MDQRGMHPVATFVIGSVILTAIVWGIIYLGPGIIQWVRESTAGATTTVEAITQNSEAYENQEVVIVARVTGNVGGFAWAIDDGEWISLINLPSGFWGTGDKYKIEGKVVQTENISLAIEVSKISKI